MACLLTNFTPKQVNLYQLIHFGSLFLPKISRNTIQNYPINKSQTENLGAKQTINIQDSPKAIVSYFLKIHPFKWAILPLFPQFKSIQVLSKFIKNPSEGASLVVQRIKIQVAMQGTLLVQFLVWEDPTHLAATKPTCHNYQAFVLDPAGCSPELVLHFKRSHHNEKPARHIRRVSLQPEKAHSATETQNSQNK